jgi:AraC-like DNA-binding protein
MKNLTELSYENLFYDQSHFIKNFKDLTKIQPQNFSERKYRRKKYLAFYLSFHLQLFFGVKIFLYQIKSSMKNRLIKFNFIVFTTMCTK